MRTELQDFLTSLSTLAVKNVDKVLIGLRFGNSKRDQRMDYSSFSGERAYFSFAEITNGKETQHWVSSMSMGKFIDCIGDSLNMDKEKVHEFLEEITNITDKAFDSEQKLIHIIITEYAHNDDLTEILSTSIDAKHGYIVALAESGAHISYQIDIGDFERAIA